MTTKKKIIIIGAGPGGLASGMLLAHQGYQVTIYEKQKYIGGRTSALKAGDFTFELGPTFVMLPQIFEEIFELTQRKLSDYIVLKKLDTLYRLHYSDGKNFHVYFNKNKLHDEIKRLFSGDEHAYKKYFNDQKRKFDLMYPCLQVPYGKWYNYLRPKLLKAFPVMDNFTSVYDVLSRYFSHEEMKMAMSFQSKYLGMSPWECPGAFTILSYVEHAFGIYHPIGGVHKITEAMAQVVKEEGGKIITNKPVKKIIVKDGKASGVEFFDGTVDIADAVIMNADFATGMSKLVPERFRGKWSEKKLKNKPYSCSTFMLYLGLSKKYNISHHNIFFAKDYKKNVDEISKEKKLPEDPSFYIQNASITDPTLAPKGKSTIYVLVPVPNLDATIDWDKEKKHYRDLIIQKIKEQTEMKDIDKFIEEERVITPKDWNEKIDVYKGAVFNLAHTLPQMLYLRPHNEFENLPGLYLVGGGTHPGSGLPTILESGRITAQLISEKFR